MCTKKVYAGMLVGSLLLVIVNLLVIAPQATGAVQDAVNADAVLTGEDWTDAEWLTSTEERTYYFWSLTNPEELETNASAAPVFEQKGPFTYEITKTKVVTANAANSLTYTESKSFEWKSGEDPNAAITGLNILYEPQRVGATGMYIEGVFNTVKAGFVANNLMNDMNNTAASINTAAYISDSVANIDATMNDTTAAGAAMANIAFSAWSDTQNWTSIFANLTVPLNLGLEDIVNNNTDLFSNVDYALWSATDPLNPTINISLTSKWGPLLYAGMGYPDLSIIAMLGDPTNSTTIKRACLYQLIACGAAGPSNPLDLPLAWARDWAIFGLVGTTFQANGGGGSWMTALDPLAVGGAPNATRLATLTGANVTEATAVGLLFGGQGTDSPTGLLATNADGTAFGVGTFLTGANSDPLATMTSYGLDAADFQAISNWAGGWMTGALSLPTILKGISGGTLNATSFATAAWGGPNPLDGTYISPGINVGLPTNPNMGLWEMLGNTPVALNASQVDNILFGPMGITTDAVVLFMYGELTGMTVPVNPATMAPSASGVQIPWNTSLVSTIYGIDENEAGALRYYVKNLMWGSQVPSYLADNFGVGRFTTLTVNEWLLGWRDPVLAFLGGNATDPTLGWVSLETNATYYASGGVSTGNATSYTVNTGASNLDEVGRAISEDGSTYLSWRTPAVNAGTLGLVSTQSLEGTSGGWISGTNIKSSDESVSLNLGGYAVADAVYSGAGEVKGIETLHYKATVDAKTNPIQAKLIKRGDILDAFPGLVPVYYGATVDIDAEPVTGRIISGDSTSNFYVDYRGAGASAPTDADLHQVFQIWRSSSLEQEDADTIENQIYANQETYTYWLNFDHWIDSVTALLWVVADAVALIAIVGLVRNRGEDDE